jgi:succinyl-CoA synthetase beta subunit
VAIKAQVLAGGRGKGTFKNGFVGGVHMVTQYVRFILIMLGNIRNRDGEAKNFAKNMLGNILVTKQTGAEGKICKKVRQIVSFDIFSYWGPGSFDGTGLHAA